MASLALARYSLSGIRIDQGLHRKPGQFVTIVLHIVRGPLDTAPCPPRPSHSYSLERPHSCPRSRANITTPKTTTSQLYLVLCHPLSNSLS